MKRLYTITLSVFFIFTLGINYLLSYDDGIFGLTKRDGGIGCVCHGNGIPHPEVTVWFVGPDSVQAGDSALFRLYMSHGPAITGGLDVASFSGIIQPDPSDTSIYRDTLTNEVSHRYPKPFVNDTVHWIFKYKASINPMKDTLYAVANSTNNDKLPDTNDHWNFSPNFVITVYTPIGIENTHNIATLFKLGQNYPNPFNPVSQIKYSLEKRGIVKLQVYDINGRSVRSLINATQDAGKHVAKFDGSSLSSGVYFYRLLVFDEEKQNEIFWDVKKMMLIK